MMTPRANIQLFNEDCLPAMRQMKDNEFNLAIVDPPYGIGIDGQKESKKGRKSDRKEHLKKGWDNTMPTADYFEQLFRVSRNQIIWGGNYFVRYLKDNKMSYDEYIDYLLGNSSTFKNWFTSLKKIV